MRLMELIYKGTVCLVETGIPCQTRLTLRKKSPKKFPDIMRKYKRRYSYNGALIYLQSGATGPSETHPEIGNL